MSGRRSSISIASETCCRARCCVWRSFGAFVEIAEGIEGLCHNSEAVDGNGQPMQLEAGLEHDFKIIKMNPEEKKVGLSIRAVGEEASRADVEAYKHPVSSTTAPPSAN